MNDLYQSIHKTLENSGPFLLIQYFYSQDVVIKELIALILVKNQTMSAKSMGEEE